jgi:hypothetical protein
MGFTLVAWSKSIDATSLTALDALADQHVRTQGPDIIVPRDYNKILFVAAVGSNVTAAQLQSPSLRRRTNLDISPILRSSQSDSLVPVFSSYIGNPIALESDEALDALATEDAAGASRVTVVAALADGEPSPASGDIFTVKASSTNAATAYTWTNVQLTFSQSLPAGTYQVVGFRHESTTGIAARLVFVGGRWRPGVISAVTASTTRETPFRNGLIGVYGEFRHNTPPTVDVLCGGADASHTFYFDLIKIG